MSDIEFKNLTPKPQILNPKPQTLNRKQAYGSFVSKMMCLSLGRDVGLRVSKV